MAETLTPTSSFSQQDSYQPPQATVSLSETSFENWTITPSTPESFNTKDEGENHEDQKPTKKRKSWGQELPTPKTNLPPRKRAKTEDEKEQRRIERVLRNRAAAQSSRERKRQEVEKLEGEKAIIEQQNQYLKDRLMAAEHEKFILTQQVAKMSAQMKALRQGSSPSSADPSPSLKPQIFDSEKIKQEIDDYPLALPTPQTITSPSTVTYSQSQSPAQPSLSHDDDSLTASPDMTQHPAAMLCDLQCHTNDCDPIIFGESSHLNHLDFSSLFAVDDAFTHDLPFAKDGITAPHIFNHPDITLNGNDFTFDSMVDFEADESNQSNHNLAQHPSDETLLTGNVFAIPFDSAAQIAATSSAQQPFHGAST
ncbi:MAG: hypothetical protein Q9217_006590 [Psora testacea]